MSMDEVADMVIAAAQKGCIERGLEPTKLRQEHLTFHQVYPQEVNDSRFKFLLRVSHPDAVPFDLEITIDKVQ